VLQNPGGATQVRGWGEKEKKKSVREMGWDGIWTREGAIKAYTMSNVTSNFVFLHTDAHMTYSVLTTPSTIAPIMGLDRGLSRGTRRHGQDDQSTTMTKTTNTSTTTNDNN